MSIGRVIRPTRDADRAAIHAYYEATKAALDKAGVDYGEEFVVCPVSALQTSIYDVDKPGDDSLGGFSSSAPDTSRKAAIDNYPRSGTQRLEILDLVVASRLKGMTRDELVVATERDPNVVTPRVKELVQGGWLEETERTRKTRAGSDATVLVASGKTMQERSGEPDV